MKRYLAAFALLPTTATAHPGDHAQAGFQANLRHLITEPDHLVMMAVALLAVAVVVWLRKGRAE